MAKTAADVLIEGLIDWGVNVVFELPTGEADEPASPFSALMKSCSVNRKE
jgi:thiamine pyrophosphate-dependent acetolactate synthase large subunit-like protein